LSNFHATELCATSLAALLFLQKRYTDAVKEFGQTLSIDPEDLQAHYNFDAVVTNGLGDDAKANEHKVRYLRFKPTSPRRLSQALIDRRIRKTTTSGRRFTSTSASRLQLRRPRKRRLDARRQASARRKPSRRFEIILRMIIGWRSCDE